MPTETRRIMLSLSPGLNHSLQVLGLNAELDQNDGVPVAGAFQITDSIARHAYAVDQASRELDQLLERNEWNLMADVLNGCADLWLCLDNPPMSFLTLIRAEVEDGHRLDGLGYKWFGEDDRKASDAKVKALLAKLGRLSPVHGDAIMAAVRYFWRHTGIDHSEERWWTVKARMA